MGDTVETRSRAAAILRQLALGNDPATGIPLSREHLIHRPEVIRALMVATKGLEMGGDDRPLSTRPLRAGIGWSDSEDLELRTLFENGESIVSIAASLQRSHGSIRSRLVKLELLDNFQVILEEAKEARRR